MERKNNKTYFKDCFVTFWARNIIFGINDSHVLTVKY